MLRVRHGKGRKERQTQAAVSALHSDGEARRWIARRYRDTDRSESTKPSLSSSPGFGRAPGSIFACHPSDEFLDFGGDCSSVRGWSARSPAPIQPKSCAIQIHHSLRLHDQQQPQPSGTRHCVTPSRTIDPSGSVWGGAACVSEPPPAGARLESPGPDRFDMKKTRTTVARSRMNRSMNLPLYHTAKPLILWCGGLLATDRFLA